MSQAKIKKALRGTFELFYGMKPTRVSIVDRATDFEAVARDENGGRMITWKGSIVTQNEIELYKVTSEVIA